MVSRHRGKKISTKKTWRPFTLFMSFFIDVSSVILGYFYFLLPLIFFPAYIRSTLLQQLAYQPCHHLFANNSSQSSHHRAIRSIHPVANDGSFGIFFLEHLHLHTSSKLFSGFSEVYWGGWWTKWIWEGHIHREVGWGAHKISMADSSFHLPFQLLGYAPLTRSVTHFFSYSRSFWLKIAGHEELDSGSSISLLAWQLFLLLSFYVRSRRNN